MIFSSKKSSSSDEDVFDKAAISEEVKSAKHLAVGVAG